MTITTDIKSSILNIEGFDLEQTLCCGQAFRWAKREDGAFYGAAGDKFALMRQNGDEITVESAAPLEFWRNYLDADTDYASMRALFQTVPALIEPCRAAGGIRILRQAPWEALASFIISQNNNIKRIGGIIERLCESFGKKTPFGYAFPDAAALAGRSPEDLAPLRCGFRARYLIDAANKVQSGEIHLDDIYSLPVNEAREKLKTIVGVGNKVADCALLFGFYRLECLPVDVWIRRALDEFFPYGVPQEILPYAGVAQQYLFHYMRTRDTK